MRVCVRGEAEVAIEPFVSWCLLCVLVHQDSERLYRRFQHHPLLKFKEHVPSQPKESVHPDEQP